MLLGLTIKTMHTSHTNTLTHTDTVSLMPWLKVSPVQSKLFTDRAIWSKSSKHTDNNLVLHLVQASVNLLTSIEEK